MPRTTVDSAGRLVIPKKVRQAAGLKPGAPVEVRCRDGRIEIEPAPIELRFARRGRFVVAVPKRRPREPFTAETMEATLEGFVRKEDESSEALCRVFFWIPNAWWHSS